MNRVLPSILGPVAIVKVSYCNNSNLSFGTTTKHFFMFNNFVLGITMPLLSKPMILLKRRTKMSIPIDETSR